MWSRLVFWLRLGAVLFAGIVGLLAVLDFYQVLQLSPNFDPWVWSISLAIIAADNVGTLISRAVRARLGRKDAKIEAALMSLLLAVTDAGDLRFQDLGASVYVTTWRGRLRGRSGRRPMPLKRIHRFRPSGYPLRSGIAWSAATGAVGECWRTHRVVHKKWHAIATTYDGVELDEAQFAKISKDARSGFTCEQFNAIVGKYSEIVTVPIWHGRNDRRQIGVLSLDRVFQADQPDFSYQLGKKDVLAVASATASAAGRILKPSDEAEE
jgi:hypothetical protein